MIRIRFLGLVLLPAALAVAVAAPPAKAQWCDGQPNIVLFLMDDVSWTSLPFFNPPVEWENSSGPDDPMPKFRKRQSPTYNRLEARLCADSGSGDVGLCPGPSNPDWPSQPSFTVIPGDAEGSSHTYSTTISGCQVTDGRDPRGDCVPSVDVIPGFGGIRRLVDTGTVFTRFYAASAKCLPARIALMLGKGANETGVTVIREDKKQPHDTLTIATALQDAGYYTGLIGKWHVTDKVTAETGFDEAIYYNSAYRGYFDKKAMACCGASCCTQAPECAPPTESCSPCDPDPIACEQNDECAPDPTCAPWAYYSYLGGIGGAKKYCWDADAEARQASLDEGCPFSVRAYADLATDFMARHAGSPDPFFLFVSFTSVHDGHRLPARTTKHYSTRPPGKSEVRPANYWGLIEETDAAIGQILTALDAHPSGDNTLVLFTSDQGADGGQLLFGDPSLRGTKGTVFEGGIRIPFIARACDQDVAQHRSDLGSHVDVFKTIAAAAGLSLPADVDGVSLYDEINTNTSGAPERDFVFSRYGNDTSVVTREGYIKERVSGCANKLAGGVCGYEDCRLQGSCQNPPLTSQENHAFARGGSRWLCDPDTAGNACDAKKCTILGKRCVPSATQPPRNQVFDLDVLGERPENLPRCVKERDCGSGANTYCRRVQKNCTGCFVAAWKLKAKALDPVRIPTKDGGVYDLTTNVEEDEELDFDTHGPAGAAHGTEDATVARDYVRDELTALLVSWRDSVVDPPVPGAAICPGAGN